MILKPLKYRVSMVSIYQDYIVVLSPITVDVQSNISGPIIITCIAKSHHYKWGSFSKCEGPLPFVWSHPPAAVNICPNIELLMLVTIAHE